MKLITAAVAAVMIKTTPALASSGHEVSGTGLLTLLFLGFVSVVILCQLIPGLVLFYSMLKELLHGTMTKSVPRTDAKTS